MLVPSLPTIAEEPEPFASYRIMKSSEVPVPVVTALVLPGLNTAWVFTHFHAHSVERIWTCIQASWLPSSNSTESLGPAATEDGGDGCGDATDGCGLDFTAADYVADSSVNSAVDFFNFVADGVAENTDFIADTTGGFGSDSSVDVALDHIAMTAGASLDSMADGFGDALSGSGGDATTDEIAESTGDSTTRADCDLAADCGGVYTCAYTGDSIFGPTDDRASECASEYTLDSIDYSALDYNVDAFAEFTSGSKGSLGSDETNDAAESSGGYVASRVDFTTDDHTCDPTSDSVIESASDSIANSVDPTTTLLPLPSTTSLPFIPPTPLNSQRPSSLFNPLPQLLFTLLLPNPLPLPTFYDTFHLSTYWCPRPTTKSWPRSSWMLYAPEVANLAWYVPDQEDSGYEYGYAPEQECGEMEMEMEAGIAIQKCDEGYGSEVNEPRSHPWDGCDAGTYDGPTCDAQNHNPEQAYDLSTATPYQAQPGYAVEQMWYPSPPADKHATYLQPVGVGMYERLPEVITTAPVLITNDSNTRPQQRRECHVDNIETIVDQLLRFGQPAMELLDILDVFDEIGVLEGDVFEAEIESWRGKWKKELVQIAEEDKVEDVEMELKIVGQEMGELKMLGEDLVTPTMTMPKSHKTPKKMLTFKRGAGLPVKKKFDNVLVPVVEKIVPQEMENSGVRAVMSWAAVARGA